MPIIHVHLWKGFSEEKINEIIEGITNVFVKIGIPSRAVEVIVHEIPKTHWGVEGKPATQSLKEWQPPE
jgi:4-oxalocrotonate tautomerase